MGWVEIWGILVFLYGCYVVIVRPESRVGIEGFKPWFSLSEKGKVIFGVVLIFAGISFFYMGYTEYLVF